MATTIIPIKIILIIIIIILENILVPEIIEIKSKRK